MKKYRARAAAHGEYRLSGKGRGRTWPLFCAHRQVITVPRAQGWRPGDKEGKEPVKLLIRQGRLIDPVGGIGGVMDVLIEDGKVAVIGSDLREPEAEVIDARGLVVCAGLVDMHVHLREPGFEYKETIETGCAAAARWGGTASHPAAR